MTSKKHILPIIVISQFCCTTLWFASNGIITELIENFHLKNNALGHLTTAVQFGFILGTLIFAIFMIADRFSPSKVFAVSAFLGAIFNILLVLTNNSLESLILFRFLTGFFLAGIYPVGMKIATDYYEKGLGKSLGFLVGALVIGTAFPHLMKDMLHLISWKYVIYTTSTLAILGGVLMFLLVTDGPFRKFSKNIDLSTCFKIFKNKELRTASFGYFGHMWELYAFWTFVPVILKTYVNLHKNVTFNIPLLSFCIIALGGVSCVFSGYFGERFQVKRTAYIALLLSGICCLISPIMFSVNNEFLFIFFLIFWGVMVIADSPLFSTLVSKSVPLETRGTALTIVNCIGFSITIISIQLISNLLEITNSSLIYMILALGPILGSFFLTKKRALKS
ncbi:nitrate/nitrite transporter [uncultured Polaribacter sp.]|uniref:MFS transporter n=1 Tax=uncultured Polaribacter sp. TaxID=174711 RepID=UPI00260807B4|nr:MFS transporter [uncultured Polaribacter sp.]